MWAHLPYYVAAYEPILCGCYLHLWKAYANASKQFKQGNLVYKRLKQLGNGQLTASANA